MNPIPSEMFSGRWPKLRSVEWLGEALSICNDLLDPLFHDAHRTTDDIYNAYFQERDNTVRTARVLCDILASAIASESMHALPGSPYCEYLHLLTRHYEQQLGQHLN